MKKIIFLLYFSFTIHGSNFLNLDSRNYKDVELDLIQEIITDEYDIYLPQTLSIDNENNLVFLDQATMKIYLSSISSIDFKSFGNGKGRGPGEFLSVWDMVVDNEGNILTTDMDKIKVIQWNTNGEFIAEYNLGSKHLTPSRMAVCNNHDWMYILSAQYGPNGIIHRVGRDGKHHNVFQKIKNQMERMPFYTDGNLACDEKGNLIFASAYNDFIRKYSPDGTMIFEKKVFDFEPNKNIMIRDGRFFEKAEDTRRSSGEIYTIEDHFIVGYSNRVDELMNTIDFYKVKDGGYEYSIKLPHYFDSFTIKKGLIATLTTDKIKGKIIRVYKYS